jgi:hypothetical protein
LRWSLTPSSDSTCHDHRGLFLPPSRQNQAYLEGVRDHLNQHLPYISSVSLSIFDATWRNVLRSALPLGLSGRRDSESKMDRETLEMYLDNPVAEKRKPTTEQERFVRASSVVGFLFSATGLSRYISSVSLSIFDATWRNVLRCVRDHLNQHLPPYMIPSHFLSLSRLPLSPSGKADLLI